MTGTTWEWISRLGEAQILLPAMLAAAWGWARAGEARLPRRWLIGTASAALLTTATKVAFIGWGVGIAAWDFTGVSGHAMFAGAILPLLGRCLASAALNPSAERLRFGVAIGWVLAILVAVSRVTTGAHSVSEAIAGCLLGSAVSLLVLRRPGAPRGAAPMPWPALAALALWLPLAMRAAPPPTTHALVTRLSLALAGHSQPHARDTWLKRHRLGIAA